ncbi:MAG: TDP-N-acetylfucosamine:lipid II N-acetylfucosaminyltransferase [Hydrogenophaga sp.]|uniref:TDP-N-acetylfucosamine:lipid II N-acetylfucosaminyltransferase n=1 Tax=Hydrogenophaga sp. TaxID=1904254 RepID=UPI001DD94074|nr:TDP-N-acetylfucosamine:lipid II N-acetylfucosaminyltransferase [Hydrogenophaga sp.]MBX3609224.1 TDP-N-acetylfucosamine:lipid II N-acetylfucosaminyltransferase [Hydrogenophaga sp.]
MSATAIQAQPVATSASAPARVLHLMLPDKFIAPFVDFVGRHFDVREHRFCLLSRPQQAFNLRADQPLDWIGDDSDEPRLLEAMFAAERIVIHGLWSERVVRLLYALPSLARKCRWAIWGGDLYDEACNGTRDEHERLMRRTVISQFAGAIGIHGDMDLARSMFGLGGERHICVLYPTNLAVPVIDSPPADDGQLGILIGNSATESNCHLEAFARIAPHWREGMHIHCPLSYGDAAYRELVVRNGRGLFGEHFHAMTEFLPLAEYTRFLRGIDIAILHHNRQQALGNAVSLLSMGKQIYMRPNQSLHRHLSDMGFVLHELHNFRAERLDEATRQHNMRLAQDMFSEQRLVQGLATLFDQSAQH